MAEARIQRKLAAILVADVVGYSRLIGTDETGTIKALNALRSELFEPKAAQHHGRTVKLMGDGELMEFPSIVDAVRFAVEVQCALSDRNASIPEDQRIAFRMGVNVGDVVVEGDDLYGDGVNIAARLEALAEPGGVCLSRSARDQVRDRLDIDLTDMGEIDAKNISRKMRVFAVVMNDKARSLMSPVQAASTTDLSTPPHRKTSEHRTWAWTVGGLAVLAALVAGLWFWRLPDADSTRSSEPLAPASVAVLPFSNMSADPQKVYFSNGVTEGIMLELSRMPSMFVPASNSTKRYAGAGVGLKEIGKELGVRYVLDGSVQQADGQVRITAKLMEIESGKQVWARRYDRPLQDVFAVQDEISTSIAALLVAQIEQADLQIAKRKPTSDMDAYDLVLQGRELVNLGTTLERDSRAKTLYERAIALDPDFAEAYAGLSEVYTRNFIFDRGDVTGQLALDKAIELGQRSLEIDPSNAYGAFALALNYIFRGRLDDAEAVLDRAHAAYPNDADVMNRLGVTYVFQGKPQEGVKLLERVLQIDPFHRRAIFAFLARGYLMLEEYEKAGEYLKRCYAEAAKFRVCYEVGAVYYVETGDMEKAREAASKLHNLAPTFTVSNARSQLPFRRKVDQDRFIEAFRKAGMSE